MTDTDCPSCHPCHSASPDDGHAGNIKGWMELWLDGDLSPDALRETAEADGEDEPGAPSCMSCHAQHEDKPKPAFDP